MSPPAPDAAFKDCRMCRVAWGTREQFLSDPALEIIGYQACLERLETGAFLFNHSCQGTLAVYVSEFADLYDGPIFQERRTGTDACPGYCLRQDELKPCPIRCECAFIREIIQLVRDWPKDAAAQVTRV